MHVRVSVPAHLVSSMAMHGMQDLGDGNIKMTEKTETSGAWKDDQCIVTDMIKDLRLKKGESTECTKIH